MGVAPGSLPTWTSAPLWTKNLAASMPDLQGGGEGGGRMPPPTPPLHLWMTPLHLPTPHLHLKTPPLHLQAPHTHLQAPLHLPLGHRCSALRQGPTGLPPSITSAPPRGAHFQPGPTTSWNWPRRKGVKKKLLKK